MPTVDVLLDEALRTMLGGDVQDENELSANITSAATSLTFARDLGTMRTGSVIAIGTELMRVWSVDSAAKTAVVRRGYQSSTAAAHTTAEIVAVNPRFSKTALLKALEQEVSDLSAPTNGLFRMLTTTLTYTANTIGYDLASVPYLQSVYAVRHKSPGSMQDWVRMQDWTLARNQDNAGGIRLKLPTGYPGQTMRIEYKADFMWNPTVGAELADDVVTITGVPTNMHDIMVMGLLLRIGPTREIKRNQTDVQGSSRRAEEVPAGSVAGSFRSTQAMRMTRIQAEAGRLLSLYPPFST